MADPVNTLLVLASADGSAGVPAWSARGLKQTLEPVAQARVFERTVNGRLVDISPPQMLIYKSTISGDDQDPPALSMVMQGAVLTVDCLATLAGPIDRDVVDGYTDGDWTFWRPRLVMVVTSFSIERDEWGAQVRWQLELEELEFPADQLGV